MCGAKEIYCCQSHCIRPIGWYIVEPCEGFVIANSAFAQPPVGTGSWSWNWNTSICGCSVPRVVRRQRCRYRSCVTCAWSTLYSTFSAMQQWADAAEENPEWWTQSQGDNLLLRRTKMRLRNEYDQSRRDGGKMLAVNVQQMFAATSSNEQWPSHHQASETFPSLAGAFDSLPGSSLEKFSNNHLSIPNSTLYPQSSMTSGQVWDDGLGERFSTTQGLLGAAGILDPGQEAASAANASTMYPNLEDQQDFWTANGPPQPALAFEQVWGEGDDATQIARSRHEVMQHTPSANHVVLNLDDPCWNNMLASSGDFVLDSGTDTGQASSDNPAYSL